MDDVQHFVYGAAPLCAIIYVINAVWRINRPRFTLGHKNNWKDAVRFVETANYRFVVPFFYLAMIGLGCVIAEEYGWGPQLKEVGEFLTASGMTFGISFIVAALFIAIYTRIHFREQLRTMQPDNRGLFEDVNDDY